MRRKKTLLTNIHCDTNTLQETEDKDFHELHSDSVQIMTHQKEPSIGNKANQILGQLRAALRLLDVHLLAIERLVSTIAKPD